jgi:amino acid transporter
MDETIKPSLAVRLRRLLIGGARDPHDPAMFHKLSLIAFFAWVGLGADGLSSSCYGPSEAFLQLGKYPHLAIFVALGTAFTIIVIVSSYSQIVELFPTGGGGYLVASHLLSPGIGMVSGCALIIDYVLTIALSIASGTEAIFSFIPLHWHFLRVWVAAAGVIVLMALNMRGVKEAVVPLLPVFLLFVLTHAFAIVYVLVTYAPHLGGMAHETVSEVRSLQADVGLFGVLFLILRAYSMGAGTYTGIEAVSNGLPILRDPKVKTAKRTMLYMAVSLVFMVIGLMLAYILCGAKYEEGKTLNAVILETMTGNWGHGAGGLFVLATLFSEAAILFVAAQAGFLDAPRVLSNMALDRWFPGRFAMLSDRLVMQNGVVLTGGAALAIMLIAGASVRYLIVLYSITVFITFVLSQLSMVRHWWQSRKTHESWKKGICINGTGLVLTSFILVSVTIAKFTEGGWITLLVTGALITLAVTVRRHYERTRKLLGRLDTLVEASAMIVDPQGSTAPGSAQPKAPAFIPDAKTAILLVNGFNGLGLHTLFGVIRIFGGGFKNFVFVQVGVVDAGTFKGAAELDRLKAHTTGELGRYVQYMNREGFYAETYSALGTDVVEEITKLAPVILKQFPQGVFFGGQLVFPEDTIFTRLLHNYIVFAVQRKLYSRGIPFMILPIRVQ